MTKFKTKIRMRLLQTLIAAVFLMAGIGPIWAADGMEVQIKEIDYLIENIHPSFWSGQEMAKTSLFLNIYIYVEDLKGKIDAIKKVVLADKHDYAWEIDPGENSNLEQEYLGGNLHLYDVKLSQNASLLSISDLKVTLELIDGTEVERVFSIPGPGELKPASGYEYVYSEKFRGKITAAHVPALAQAKVNFLEFKNNTFTFTFSVSDNRVFNGAILFYDKNKYYLGETVLFYNRNTEENVDFINDGQRFFTDGRPNRVQLGPADLQMERPQKLSKIKYLQLCLTDGGQFINTKKPDNYLYRSLSELIPVK